MFNVFKDKFVFNEPEIIDDAFSEELLREIKLFVNHKFASQLKIYLLDSGSCNGCELELQLLFSPYFDMSALGFEIVYDIHEADLLMITGLMTENMSKELELVIKAFKNRKNVILLGDCPVGKAPFRNNFALADNVETLFPLAYYIDGCPPEPKDILMGIYQFLKNYD